MRRHADRSSENNMSRNNTQAVSTSKKVKQKKNMNLTLSRVVVSEKSIKDNARCCTVTRFTTVSTERRIEFLDNVHRPALMCGR